jgi:protein phosphatase
MAARTNRGRALADTQPDLSRPPEAAPPLVARAGGATDTGRIREVNQDHFVVATFARAAWLGPSSFAPEFVRWSEKRARLYVVADGMGGHAGGQRASVLAIETALGYLADAPGLLTGRAPAELEAAVRRADGAVFAEGQERAEVTGMGTTLTIACAIDDTLHVAHAGDSRAYFMRSGALHQITKDHTLVAQMVDAGVIDREQAKRHHMRHMVTNVVGGGSEGVHVDLHEMKLAPGDLVLLCSDGLTEVVPLERISAMLFTERDPAIACRQLVDAANEAGGPDNITVVIAAFEPARAPATTHPDEVERLPPQSSGWFDGPRGGFIGHGMP